MSYQRKTRDIYVLYQNFGYGEEEILTEETKHEILCQLRVYRDNQPYPVRIKKKRIPKEILK